MQQKTEKNIFVSQIIAQELVLLNVPMKNKILFIDSQCVNKQSQDFNSAWTRLPFCLSKGPLKLMVLAIYLTTFSESVISEIQKL